MKKKLVFFLGAAMVLALGIIVLSACAGPEGPVGPPGPTGPAGPAGSMGACDDCHNETTLVYSKSKASDMTLHQTGRGWSYAGGRAACKACHSSEGFQEKLATGKGIEELEGDVTNPSPPNCRTCHNIHETYTKADFALSTAGPVTLYATGDTFDLGAGNLCANCHQPRRVMEVENGMVNVSSTHWGPHHGPQSSMMLGTAGALASGSPSVHYMLVKDGCPQCHMVNADHTLVPNVAACKECHADASNFDIGGVQTEVEELIEELTIALSNKHMIETAAHEPYHAGMAAEDMHPVVGEYPEAEAGALWNWIYIAIEDSSKGVHNPAYTKALLEASIEALK